MLINHFLIDQSWYLVDLPGYGYAQRSKRAIEKLQRLIEGYILDREQLISLFVLVDSRLEPQKKDLEFIRFLGENGVPFGIIFTKAALSSFLIASRTLVADIPSTLDDCSSLFTTNNLKSSGKSVKYFLLVAIL